MGGEISDFLVVGSGLAGLLFALRAAEVGTVTVITKKRCGESSTNYAQGGVASVLGEDDSFELHARDTLRAGAGLCHPKAVRIMVEEGPSELQRLIELGALFSRREDGKGLAREFAECIFAVAPKRSADDIELDFHRTILEASHNKMISRMHHVISAYFLRAAREMADWDIYDTKEDNVWQHRAIAQAFKARNIERARAHLSGHLAELVAPNNNGLHAANKKTK